MISLDPLLPYISLRGGLISSAQIGAAMQELFSRAENRRTPGSLDLVPTDAFIATNAVRTLQLLGHIDAQEDGRFALSNANWARLPGQRRFRAVLCGWVPPGELNHRKVIREQFTFTLFNSHFSIFGTFIDADSPAEMGSIAEESRIPITSGPAAWDLAWVGEDIRVLESAIDSRWSQDLLLPESAQHFDIHALKFRYRDGKDLGQNLTLWRWPGHRVPWQFALSKANKFVLLEPADVSLAKHASISDHAVSILKYHSKSQRLACPVAALPPVYLSRALSLCSGKLPQTVTNLGTNFFVWRDIPPAVADQICKKLGQVSSPKDIS